ncbi:MAG TPA: sigma-70 family RNA polymerase sigma factor [Steroidobacteraceae bacterium]
MTADNPAHGAEGLTEDPSEDRRRDLRARCDAIFREHNDALVRAVYSRLHSWEEATEIVQEAYVRVFRLDNPPPINFLRAYLYKTAFNLAYDRRGERTIRQQREEFVYTEVYSDRERENPTPERLCLDEEVRACLQVAVNKLPPKCRMAFTLVELENQTVRQAAGTMGISEMAVYQLVNRAYGHMARVVVERGWRK